MLNYPCPPIVEHAIGEQMIFQITSSISDLPNSFQMNDPNYIRLCSLISSLFFEYNSNDSVVPIIKQLIENNNELNDLFPMGLTAFQSVTLFISRLFFKNRFKDFYNLILANFEWRNKNFKSFSWICDVSFLELLYSAIIPINQKTFIKGSFNISLIPEKPIFIERKDTIIHSIVKTIQTQVRQGTSNNVLNEMIARIIIILCDLFSDGFIAPKTAILPQLRNGWYCLCVASKLQIQSPEIVALKRAVDEAIMSDRENPRELMMMALNMGFKCGMVAPWIIYMAVAAKENELYEKDADLMNDQLVTSVADSLYYISNLLVEMTNEELFEIVKNF